MQISRGIEPIDPQERKSYSFDFSDYLDEGDTISSAVWSVEVSRGTDPSPSDILDGAPSTDGTGMISSHWISGATAGVVYRLIALATTADGSDLELSGILRCVEST